MNIYPDDGGDTIFAVSSGTPPAAIAVMRVSGPAAGDVLRRLAGALPVPRRATVRALRGSDGDLLDRALVLWFPGPATATGEDLAELHLHGGRAVVAAVSKAMSAIEGCRPALAGEFTRRAFANGRIDLAEAEGLADLLAAETEMGRRQALRVAEGGLSRLAEDWRQKLLLLSARAEAQLQFGDDEGDVVADPRLPDDIAALAEAMRASLAQPPAERLREGFRVVIAGPPNAGKSTLINALAGRDAAIVSPEAGTTRDLVEVPIQLDGVPILLIDSAGLREPGGDIERIGIARAERAIEGADVVLWLGAPEEAPQGDIIRVHARADLEERLVPVSGVDIVLSALRGDGMNELRQQLINRLVKRFSPDRSPLLNMRQRGLIRSCMDDLDRARESSLPEIAAEHLRHALAEIDAVTGRAFVEDMLNALFGQFCLGK